MTKEREDGLHEVEEVVQIDAIDILIACLLGFGLFYFGVTLPTEKRRRRVRERLERFTLQKAQVKKEEPAEIVITRDQLSTIPLFNRILRRMDFAAALRRLLDQAGMKMTVGSMVLIMLIVASVAFLFTVRLQNPALTMLVTIASGFLPLLWVKRKKKRRLKLFERHFPDALDLMTSALRAGLSFVGALGMVGKEAQPPISEEFSKTYEEQALGVPIEESLQRLTQRIDSLDLRFFVTALLIQRDIGGNLTELLEKISLTIRERFKLIGQVRAQTAQGRFTGWMLTGMPFIMALIISLLNRQYIMLLVTERLGQYMIGMALFMQFLGFLVIRKVVNIKP
ncbi:MAG: type II secretion system F family protein [bacterium]|nr:type II secretion system F family protein [candidate division KSB1 bacterium]MDH7558979.1 type II secretion system F family protein [bacterium]